MVSDRSHSKYRKREVDSTIATDNFSFPELSRKSSCILYGGLREPPQGPQGLPNAPPADPGRAQDIAFRWWDPVMTYATFHAPETSFGPHFNTFLAWVETRGHRASYEMYDVHDVHDLDRSGAGPISNPIHKNFFKKLFIFSKFQSVCPKEIIQENRKMPSEWLGVHGGRSYGPSPRGSSLPSPAVLLRLAGLR